MDLESRTLVTVRKRLEMQIFENPNEKATAVIASGKRTLTNQQDVFNLHHHHDYYCCYPHGSSCCSDLLADPSPLWCSHGSVGVPSRHFPRARRARHYPTRTGIYAPQTGGHCVRVPLVGSGSGLVHKQGRRSSSQVGSCFSDCLSPRLYKCLCFWKRRRGSQQRKNICTANHCVTYIPSVSCGSFVPPAL